MKKFYVMGLLCFLVTSISSAQFQDDMEWPAGDCPPHWGDFWNGLNCPNISTVFAHSGTQCGWMGDDPASDDYILNLGGKILGQWGLEFWMYIPSGKEGYMNLQGVIPVTTGEWIVGNIFFNQDTASPGVGLIDDCFGAPVNFNFPHDEWFKIVMNVDISSGISTATWQFNVDGVDVLPFGTPFTNNEGTVPTSLGGINFYAISANYEVYVDTFTYVEGFIDPNPDPVPLTDDMEWVAGDCEDHWTTFQGDDICPELANFGHTGDQSGVIEDDGVTNNIFNLGNEIFGEWYLEFWMYVPEGKEGFFDIQGVLPVNNGESIVGNFFFNQDAINPGIGVIDDTVLGDVNFNFPHDEWFKINLNFDFIPPTGGPPSWSFLVNGVEVIPEGTDFTNEAGQYPTSLGGLHFASYSSNTTFYFDDFCYGSEAGNCFIAGVNDFTAIDFTIYPNPVNEVFQIESEVAISNVSIYTQLGQKVMHQRLQTNVDVSQLANGLYFVEVETDTGKGIQKFIKY